MGSDVLDTLEVLGRFGVFWVFVFSRTFRREVRARWESSGVARRAVMMLDGVVNTLVGLLPLWIALAILWWR